MSYFQVSCFFHAHVALAQSVCPLILFPSLHMFESVPFFSLTSLSPIFSKNTFCSLWNPHSMFTKLSSELGFSTKSYLCPPSLASATMHVFLWNDPYPGTFLEKLFLHSTLHKPSGTMNHDFIPQCYH